MTKRKKEEKEKQKEMKRKTNRNSGRWEHHIFLFLGMGTRKVDTRLPGKENSNSHGARPVHQIISSMKWSGTSRLSIKDSLFRWGEC